MYGRILIICRVGLTLACLVTMITTFAYNKQAHPNCLYDKTELSALNDLGKSIKDRSTGIDSGDFGKIVEYMYCEYDTCDKDICEYLNIPGVASVNVRPVSYSEPPLITTLDIPWIIMIILMIGLFLIDVIIIYRKY